MRVVYAIPVRHVEALHSGGLVAVGIESNILVMQQIPTPVTVPLVVALAGSHIEAQANVTHKLNVRVLGPDLAEAAAAMDADYVMAPGPNTPAGWEVRSVVPMGVQFQAVLPGTYSIEISTDGSAATSVPIIVEVPAAP